MLNAAPGVAQRLVSGNHVERHWQRAALVDVVQPQLRPGELPLDVAILLYTVIVHVEPSVQRVSSSPDSNCLTK